MSLSPIHSTALFFKRKSVSELTYLFVPVLLLWDSVLTLYIPLKCSVNAGQLFVFTFLLSVVVAAKCLSVFNVLWFYVLHFFSCV